MSKYNAVNMLENSETTMDQVLIIGRTEGGKVAIFTDDADMEKMIILLERAKSALIRQIEAREEGS